jgi:5-methylcytosine-specific restriction endonuclease McrA
MAGRRDPVTHRTPEQVKKMSRGYNARPEVVDRRVKQNAARRQMMKEGLVRKGDGKDVDHKKPLHKGGSNKRSNLRVLPKSLNRAWRSRD